MFDQYYGMSQQPQTPDATQAEQARLAMKYAGNAASTAIRNAQQSKPFDPNYQVTLNPNYGGKSTPEANAALLNYLRGVGPDPQNWRPANPAGGGMPMQQRPPAMTPAGFQAGNNVQYNDFGYLTPGGMP